MQPLVTTSLMRESDAFTIEYFVEEQELMARAGQAIYECMGHRDMRQGRIAVVCGSGNNGGDGYRVATLLAKHDLDVTVLFTKRPKNPSSLHYFNIMNNTPTGNDNLHVHPLVTSETSKDEEDGILINQLDLTGYDVVVDCVLGTGFKGTPRGMAADCIRAINTAHAAGAKVVSADINSGMDGDSGTGALVVDSDLTVAIGAPKIGMALPDAGNHIADVITADIGILFAGTPFQLIDEAEMDAVIESTQAYQVEAQMGSFNFMYLIALANEARDSDVSLVYTANGGRATAMTGNLFVQRPSWISNELVGMQE